MPLFGTVQIRTDDFNDAYSVETLYSLLKQSMSKKLTQVLVAVATATEIHIFDLHTKQLLEKIPSLLVSDYANCRSISFFSKEELLFSTKESIFAWDLSLKRIATQVKAMIPPTNMKVIKNNLIYHGGSTYVGKWNRNETTATVVDTSYNIYEIEPIDKFHFLTCHEEGFVTVWNVHSFTSVRTIQIGQNDIYSLTVMNSHEIIAAGEDGVFLKNMETDEVRSYSDNIAWYVSKLSNKSVAIARDGGRAYEVFEFDLETKQAETLFKLSHLPYTPFVAHGNTLFYISDSGICTYNVETKEHAVFSSGEGEYVTNLSVAITN
jgi:WD40 repeat protein